MADEQKPESGKPGAQPPAQPPQQPSQKSGPRNFKNEENPSSSYQPEKKFDGYLAEVVEVSSARTGMCGDVKQAMCKILEGKDKGRVIRRNVKGYVKVGNKLRLPDTSREDKPIKVR